MLHNESDGDLVLWSYRDNGDINLDPPELLAADGSLTRVALVFNQGKFCWAIELQRSDLKWRVVAGTYQNYSTGVGAVGPRASTAQVSVSELRRTTISVSWAGKEARHFVSRSGSPVTQPATPENQQAESLPVDWEVVPSGR